MKILMITSEAFPFVKTGGLADAVSALAIALHKCGHDVRIVLPRYYTIRRDSLELLNAPLKINIGNKVYSTSIYKTTMPGTTNRTDKIGLPVYFIDYEPAFGRDGVYGSKTESDFRDNPFRFSILCNGVFELCKKINWYPDIMHAHDWASALVPVLLKFYKRKEQFSQVSSVLTIHNLGYQGVYSKENYPITGMKWTEFYKAGFEDWDNINFLKAGLVSADVLTTVSPTYAQEIQTAAYGFRMDPIIRNRKSDVYGILNGVNIDVWNPMNDNKITANYSVKTMDKKAENKAELQKRMGLKIDSTIPVVGIITRLTDQKGVSELFGPTYGCVYNMCVDFKMQFIVLGSGEKWCEDELRNLNSKLPNMGVYIGYDDELSHLIEAGSDFYLMPSKYEPCGLNQMYSLMYGTLPIVRRTGGLADTVEQYNEKTGEGTGFMLNDLTPRSIYDTVGWAMYAWYNKPEHIKKMKIAGMKKNFSWEMSAKKYEDVYKIAQNKVKE
ncbi:MAG: glycogen synthase [Treponema sp. CETP13]|nr:MAG: glycogen synthase [Treponema sp. CETP13]